jgi:hypothetical protein
MSAEDIRLVVVGCQNYVARIWGAEPNGDKYLQVGLDLSSENDTHICSCAMDSACADFAPMPATRTTRTEGGLPECRCTRRPHGLD